MYGRGRGRGGPFVRGGPPPGDREKAMRSIFVANVSFDTTEEQLGTVLREVGPIVSLKLIYDPATGKPRGFGFCEYEDTETAMSAVRNLAGREVNGRPLRIDSASNAPNSGGAWGEGGGGRGGMPPPPSQSPQQQQQQQLERPMYGEAVPPENAPEVITKAVASLPPEQMFELMKQMKWFIQQNPQEARQLLLHNPQLAYALLQAQVVMKIVDVEAAHNILHRTARGPSLLAHSSPSANNEPPPPPPPPSHQQMRGGPGGGGVDPKLGISRGDQYQGQRPTHVGPPPPPMQREERGRGAGPPPPPGGDFRARPPPHGGGGPGGPPGVFERGPPGRTASPPRESRPGPSPSHFPSRDHAPPAQSQDQDKANLIMQVLSLTDEQIQMLPPDQRSSILKLKDQIARSR